MRRLFLLLLVVPVLAGCLDLEPDFDTVQELFAAVGGEDWCDDELAVSVEPFVGTCGDGATDSRVLLGVGGGGEELRISVGRARERLAGDGQLLLVPTDPDREYGWQLRSRDRGLLEEAQAELGGVILDSVTAVDEYLGETASESSDEDEHEDDDV